MEPLTKELGNLIELLETTDDEDKKLRLEEEIAQVKEMIGYYSDLENDSDFNIKQTVKKLLSVGETKTANEIAEAQLLSSKLSVDSIESTSDFNETLVTVSKDLNKFKKDISEVSRDEYLVKKGKKKLSPKIKREIATLSRNRDKLYKKRMSYIQKELSNCQRTMWGFIKNSVRCKIAKEKYQSWMRQALSEKQRYNKCHRLQK